jgi:ornithine cyclodeaminase/alanine dehydrogenase
MKTLLLSRKDIESFFTMRMCMEAVEKAFAGLSEGKAVMPQRTPISMPDKPGLALFMPAYIPGLGALGAKVVAVYNQNVQRYGLPAVMGTILLLDESSGFPMAVMDGGFITAMRTGAASGVATKHMARRDAAVGMIFGSGVQAFTQALAIHEARPLRKLLIWSLDSKEVRDGFARRVADQTGVQVELATDPALAVGAADVVVLATSAADPIVKGSWFRGGTHINSIGSHMPKMRELDTLTVQRSRIVCDHIDACKAEAGDFIIPAQDGEWDWSRVAGSLGEVITGKVPGRAAQEDITLFKSVGLAIQDVSAAKAVFDEAVRRGIGTEFQF